MVIFVSEANIEVMENIGIKKVTTYYCNLDVQVEKKSMPKVVCGLKFEPNPSYWNCIGS